MRRRCPPSRRRASAARLPPHRCPPLALFSSSAGPFNVVSCSFPPLRLRRPPMPSTSRQPSSSCIRLHVLAAVPRVHPHSVTEAETAPVIDLIKVHCLPPVCLYPLFCESPWHRSLRDTWRVDVGRQVCLTKGQDSGNLEV
nr:uncharacterized protein LOC109741577 [Aegilops tauschii subsp. strangulata]